MKTSTQGYQPKTGQPCHCRPGNQRDNCPDCEGTGQRIDFAAIRAQNNPPTQPTPGPAPAASHTLCEVNRGLAFAMVLFRDGLPLSGFELQFVAERFNTKVPNHADLVAALVQIEAILTQPVQFTGSETASTILRGDAAGAVKVARAAIAAATGKQSL